MVGDRFRRRWRAPEWLRLDYGGVVVGLLFVVLSVTPSLLPRPLAWQGIVSGLSFGVGYLVGVVLWKGIRAVVPWRNAWLTRWAWWIVLAVWVAATIVFGRLAEQWQNGIRTAVGMERISGFSWIRYGAILVVTAVICIAIGKLIRMSTRRLIRQLTPAVARVRRDPTAREPGTRRWATGVGAALAAMAVTAVSAGVVFGGLAFLDAKYDRAYRNPDPSIARPTSALRSGSPASAVPWETVGRNGSEILGRGPTATQIAAVTGQSAREPIRVYVGLESADTYAERARLAVDELERTGAAERSVLVVAGTTGTGWLEPAAIDGVEYLYGGDTALVAIQYAKTPSWVSEVFSAHVPEESTAALFDAVHEWWSDLPPDDRPQLVLYGLSLGAKAVQAPFSELGDLDGNLDGAVFAGTPWNTPLWQHLTAARDTGTSMVAPTLHDGAVVRWMSQPEDLSIPTGEWGHPRIAYLQHGNDPVVWLDLSVFWHPPGWMEAGERAAVVSPDMRWIPIVSGFHTVVDFMMGETVPADYGHRYGNVMIDAWIAVIGDPQLDPAALERIRALIASYDTVQPVSQ